jgi:hypothetical protein
MTTTFRVDITQDDDPIRPDDWDSVTLLALDVDRYLELNTAGIDVRALQESDDAVAYLRDTFDALAITPVYAYCHSGVTIRAGESNPFTCPWDSGLAGFAWTTRERLDYMGISVDDAARVVRQDIEEWDKYLTGDVWIVSVVNDATGETVESLGDVYGYEWAETEGSALLADVESRERKALESVWVD